MARKQYQSQLANSLREYIEHNTDYIGDISKNGLVQISNPKWLDFEGTGIRRKEALLNNSVTNGLIKRDEGDIPGASVQGSSYSKYSNVLYASLDGTKANRVYEYRLMAAFPEVSNALDDIANDFINLDEKGECVHFFYRDELLNDKMQLSTDQREILKKEFKYFVSLFQLERYGKKYCMDYLIDGELYLELIICNKKPEDTQKGILGVLKLQTELMEVVFKDKYAGIPGAFIGKELTVNDDKNPTRITKIQPVPYQANQIFYISTGNWDPTGQWIVPFVERARKRYIQLSYLEDAIVIYRLVRAPERLVFNVDCGNLPPVKAEAYLHQLKNTYWKTRSFDVNYGDIMQKYEPQTMLDAYWCRKGTVEISTLKGGDNLGKLDDLEYFQKALYRSLRVPESHLASDAQKHTDPSNILQDELKFAELIIDIQNQFAEEIKQTFITHLKLKGIYDQYKLRENLISVKFEPPSNYFRFRQLQGIQMAGQAFSALANNECLSKSYLMQHVMGMEAGDIINQYELRKLEAAKEWELEQIKANGPDWKSLYVMQAAGQGQQGGNGGGGDMGGLGGPDLGGGELGGMGEGLPEEGPMEGPDFSEDEMAASEALDEEPSNEPL